MAFTASLLVQSILGPCRTGLLANCPYCDLGLRFNNFYVCLACMLVLTLSFYHIQCICPATLTVRHAQQQLQQLEGTWLQEKLSPANALPTIACC